MIRTAILVDGCFYRKRANHLWGPLTAEERATIHGNDEHIRIKTAKKAAEFYIRLMRMC